MRNVPRVQALATRTDWGDVTDPAKQPALKLPLSSLPKKPAVPQRVLVISMQEDRHSDESISLFSARNTGETLNSVFKHNSHITTITCVFWEKKNPT